MRQKEKHEVETNHIDTNCYKNASYARSKC